MASELSSDAAPPLKLLWINRHAAPVGGCERYMREAAEALSERGVESSLLYEVDGRVDAAFVRSFAGAFPVVELSRQLEDLRPDLVYLQNSRSLSTLQTLGESPVPVLQFIHDHRLLCLREHKYTALTHRTCTRSTGPGCYACLGFLKRTMGWPGVGLRGLWQIRAEQLASQAFDGHVVASDYTGRQLTAHGFDPSRIHRAPLFAAVKVSTGAKRADSVVFAGQLTRGKGVDLLLRALRRLPQARLTIAGRGPQERALRRLACKLKIDARVEFAGWLPPRELERRIERAAVVAIPSRTPETFGLAGIEAQALGTAVVASDIGGVTEWLRPEETGLLFPSGDERQLADALRRIIDDPPWATQLGRAGQQRCRAEFTRERHIAQLLALFQTFCPPLCRA